MKSALFLLGSLLCGRLLAAEPALEPLSPADFPPLPALRTEEVARLKSLVGSLLGLPVKSSSARKIRQALREFHPTDPRTGLPATGLMISGNGLTEWIAPFRGGYWFRTEFAYDSIPNARFFSVELYHQQKLVFRRKRPYSFPPPS